MEQMTENDADGVIDEVPPAVTSGRNVSKNSIMREFFVGQRGKVISEYCSQR